MSSPRVTRTLARGSWLEVAPPPRAAAPRSTRGEAPGEGLDAAGVHRPSGVCTANAQARLRLGGGRPPLSPHGPPGAHATALACGVGRLGWNCAEGPRGRRATPARLRRGAGGARSRDEPRRRSPPRCTRRAPCRPRPRRGRGHGGNAGRRGGLPQARLRPGVSSPGASRVTASAHGADDASRVGARRGARPVPAPFARAREAGGSKRLSPEPGGVPQGDAPRRAMVRNGAEWSTAAGGVEGRAPGCGRRSSAR